MPFHSAIAALMFLVPLRLRAAEGTEFAVEETSVASLEAAYLSGKTSAHAVTQAYLDRIAAYDKRLSCVESLVAQTA